MVKRIAINRKILMQNINSLSNTYSYQYYALVGSKTQVALSGQKQSPERILS